MCVCVCVAWYYVLAVVRSPPSGDGRKGGREARRGGSEGSWRGKGGVRWRGRATGNLNLDVYGEEK